MSVSISNPASGGLDYQGVHNTYERNKEGLLNVVGYGRDSVLEKRIREVTGVVDVEII